MDKRNTQEFQGISFVVLNLKEDYSKSNVWLFSLGFVRAFLPHGCADRSVVDTLVFDGRANPRFDKSFLMRSLTDFPFAL